MDQSISRRTFLKTLLGISGAAALGGAGYQLLQKHRSIPGRLLGPSASLGHQLRDHHPFPAPTQTLETEIAIIGGGVSGLSAGWWLQKHDQKDFMLLEMENETGGNARSGQNAVSAFPWGAHYVPLPSENAQYVRMLFEELGVIQGYSQTGLPIYNDLYLCHEPGERLFKEGRWQDGLVPTRGARPEDHEEIKRFFRLTQALKQQVGRDGKRAFAIPLDDSSQDPELRALDQISMRTWLENNDFHSKLLYWYVNYCCRDDYGAPMETVSAWAGLHYFAGRNGRAANAEPQSVLTWPEGNGWLVNRLKEKMNANIKTRMMVFHVENVEHGVNILAVNTDTGQTIKIHARQAIYAGPRFVAQHIMPSAPFSERMKSLEYSPWLVANLTLKHLPHDGEGAPMAWDNVGYHDQSLGYVVATHQNLTLYPTKTVITYYRPLDHGDPRQARKEAYTKSLADWQSMILSDLKTMHPQLEPEIEQLDVWIWGHGMIRPKVGYIWGETRQELLQPWGNLHFAHSDMSGISIFEEAQYRGVMAAQAVLKNCSKNA